MRVLESAGELRRVRAGVSPILEIAQIADRVSKMPAPVMPHSRTRAIDPLHFGLGGRALLFEDVEGSKFPVLINAYGSYRRMEMALGCHGEVRGLEDGHTAGGLSGIADRLASLTKPEPPTSLAGMFGKAREIAPLVRIMPRRVRSGACQEVNYLDEDVDLRILPIIRCWPLDGDLGSVGFPADVNNGIDGVLWDDERIRGRFITFAGVHTIHPDDLGKKSAPSHNIGMYRVQLLGPRRLAMHWHMHHDGAAHWRAWKERGQRMPVAIVLGGESVLPYAATAPLSPGISELLMAGFLNRGGIPLVACKSVPLRVPANAEIVIEGYVSTEAGMPDWSARSIEPLGDGGVVEGPFGDHTGFYSMPDRYPITEVTALTHKRDAVYPTTIVGLPPQEDYYMGKATERVFLPLLQTMIPDVIDYDLPMFGAFHNCVLIKIKKAYPFQARRVMHAVWGAGQMAWTKCVIVVDEDVEVHDYRAVLRRVAERCDPVRDLVRQLGPVDILDHASPRLGVGAKIGFDATRKVAGEEAAGMPIDPEGRARLLPDAEDARRVMDGVKRVDHVLDAALPEELGRGWLLVRVEKPRPHAARAVLDHVLKLGDQPAPPFVIALGEGVDVQDTGMALFHWCANTAMQRDVLSHDSTVESTAFRSGVPRTRIGFDATPKRPEEGHPNMPVREWPPMIEMDQTTIELVERRWGEYGID